MSYRKKTAKKVTFRINEMLVTIISIYILLVSIQMWLLFGTINKALDQEHLDFAAYSAIGSVILFLIAIYFLRYVKYIPTGTKNEPDENENHKY
ncbi:MULTISPECIES: DUF6755 family protein [Chryseobacterium]|uniref:DUF6755 family protein n=1 Tax=Chryseobacterium TaxID=59732 RepID=UPI000D12B74D|nr:DUF6755 family protein [Chryseobacterium aurantiacum]